MKKKRITLSVLILLMLLLTTTGCWDRRELEERISAIAISIDRAEPSEEGQPMYLVSIQIPIPVRIAGGAEAQGEGGADAVKVVSSTGFTVAHAFGNIQKRMNQQLFMGHTRVIAVSKEIAREGVKELIDGFRRDPAIRRLLWFIVVEGEAVELLRSDPKIEQIPTVFIMSLMENGAKSGMIPDITLGRFYISVSNPSLQPILNYVRASKEDISWIGVALFDNQKMIGELTAKESWFLLHLRNENTGGNLLIFPDRGDQREHMVIRPMQIDTSNKIQIVDGKVKAHYEVNMQANIIEKNFDIDLSDSKNIEKLARVTEEALEEEAKKLIDLLQKKYKIDSIKLGQQIKSYHYSDWQKMNWKEEFPKADISVSYRVEFRRIGMQMR